MTLALLASAAVQLNDPDPLVWVLLYGLSALVSALGVAGRAPGLVAGVLATLALSWAVALAGDVPDGGLQAMWAPEAMDDPGLETARELGGLLLAGAWMGLTALRT